ncbi:MAG: division/cell wall cluster transcriptional repressor MraZ [Planctomycetota bacterium]
MSPLTGYRDHRIDGKDRVVIPAAFAHRIQAESDGRLYLVPGTDAPCIEAYPARVYESMAASQIPNRFEGRQDLRRLFFQNAEEVELKGPGRITLPKRFLDRFRDGIVRVAGMNTYLELWDPKAWEERMATALTSLSPPPSTDEEP